MSEQIPTSGEMRVQFIARVPFPIPIPSTIYANVSPCTTVVRSDIYSYNNNVQDTLAHIIMYKPAIIQIT